MFVHVGLEKGGVLMAVDNKSSFLRIFVVLTTFCVLSGALLAWVHSFTAEAVERAALEQRAQAVSIVLPSHTNDPLADACSIALAGTDRELEVYPAFSGTEFVGAAVESYSLDGFSGEIVVMYGFDAHGRVVGYEVVSQAETPGLGARMQQWFRMDRGNRSVIGLDPCDPASRLTADGGSIDGITAATITSRAFVDAMARARAVFDVYCSQKETR